ncbi:hypothetical protein J4E83_005768 [Alternaria metachromatica]|uniref:uncharacterized protein n=1 Tax=Alternaria metachromatica TaxID=283354 RepID=UPI0020C3C47D|nr:uncharacterized protein J4E83_005768 [Alternaria metachromatica]KAI4619911.1 hypothetical protein J4E83_005768 [Alternaria metachromatica]
MEEAAADGEEENHTEVLTNGHGTNGVGYLMNRNQRLHNGKTCDDVAPCASSYEDAVAVDVGIGVLPPMYQPGIKPYLGIKKPFTIDAKTMNMINGRRRTPASSAPSPLTNWK